MATEIDSNLISAFWTSVTTIATVVIAWFTVEMAKSTKLLQQISSRQIELLEHDWMPEIYSFDPYASAGIPFNANNKVSALRIRTTENGVKLKSIKVIDSHLLCITAFEYLSHIKSGTEGELVKRKHNYADIRAVVQPNSEAIFIIYYTDKISSETCHSVNIELSLETLKPKPMQVKALVSLGIYIPFV